MLLPENPSILVLLVATDGARWLPDVLKGLRAQQHRPLKVLAIDNASTDGSGQILSKAFGERRVVTLERRVGYGRALAAALKVAGDRGLAADAFLLVHDDAALSQGAIGALVDALRGDGVGVAGAKLLDWDDPSVLQDIGRTTDRYGRLVPRVERGELDQGQHDGMHEVLYATSAALLVSREVVERVGLFDLRYVALRDDLDLCWRARLAGYRTVVTSEASVRHAAAGVGELRASAPRGRVRYFGDRNMIATLIKNYSLPRLALALPATIAVSMVNALLYLVRGRRASALQVLEALQWNVVHLPSTLRARVRAQHARAVGDAEVTALMHHGATRLRAQIGAALEKVVGEVETGDEAVEYSRPRLVDRVRAHPGVFAVLAVSALILLAVRPLLVPGLLAGVDLSPFPERATGFFAEFASGLRGAGAGGAAPASPGLVVLGVLEFVCFGSPWVAQRVLLIGLPLTGGLAMARLGRAVGLGPGARRLAAVSYAAAPLLLGSYGAGRLGDLVLLAAAPAILQPLVRVSLGEHIGWRGKAGGIALLAVTTSLAPWALVLFVGAAAVLAASRPAETLRVGAVIVAGALALLLPWSVELFRPGSPLGAGGPDASARMVDVLGLQVGSVRPLPRALTVALPLAALAGALAARNERRALAARLGSVAAAGALLAWLVARGLPWIAPRPALPLAAAAVGAALLAGIAFEAAAPLRTRIFGASHLATGLVGLALAAQLGYAVAWIGGGKHPGIFEAGSLAPSFLRAEAQERGAFRVAWIGGSVRAPRATVTGPEGTTFVDHLERPSGAGARVLREAVAAIAAGATETGGRTLATLGVRYLIVRPDAEPALGEAVARQVDLSFSQRFHGAAVFENSVGLPVAASLGARRWVAASEGALDAVAAAGPIGGVGKGFERRSATELDGAVAKGAEEIVLAEEFSGRWVATAGGEVVEAERSFGWATRFRAEPDTQVRIVWQGQMTHRAAIVGELILVAAFMVWWSQRAARERGER